MNLLSGFQKQFTLTNNQLRTSSNSMSHATVHDGQIVTETVQRKAPGNVGNTGTRGTQSYGQVTDNKGKLVICYNCRGEGHVSRQCKEKKRVKDSQYFKDKMLLMEDKEKGAVLDAEAEAFLADVECTAPYDQPLAITTTNIFEVSHEDVYDSDVDEGPHAAAAAFMANLSSTSGTNGATTSHVNEVHTNDNQIFDNVNHLLAHRMHQEEHLDFDVKSDIDDNTIPYHQYQLDSEVQDVPTEVASVSPGEISMITILDYLRNQLDGHLKVNQEQIMVNDSLRAELARCELEIQTLKRNKKELSREQVYWLPAEELATQKSNPPKPVTLFVHTRPAPSKEQLQGKDDTIKKLQTQINSMSMLNVKPTVGSFDKQALETELTQLKDAITSVRIQNDRLKITALTAENAKLKSESLSKMHSGPIVPEKPKVLGPGMSQWKPTGRRFTLYDEYPLTRIVELIVDPLELTPCVSSNSKVTMISRFTDYKLSNRKAGSKGISGCSQHMIDDHSKLTNYVDKFIGTERINDEDLFGFNDLDGDEVIVDVTASENVEPHVIVAEKEVSAASDEVVTTTEIVEEPEKPLKKKDQIELEEEVARKLEAEMKAELDKEERIAREKNKANRLRKYFAAKRAEEIRNKPPTKAQQKSFMCTYKKNMEGYKQKDFKGKSFDAIKKMFDKVYKRVNTFMAIDSEVMEGSKKTQAEVTEGSSKRAGDEIEQESSKRQRLEKEDDTAELKRCLEIVLEDDDDVTIKATPLSSKSPTIVDSKIYKEGKKSYFKIIRADGNSQNYLTFGTMFKNFNREELEVLRSIVKERFKKTKPVNDMFEHHVEDNIWKYQQGVVKVHNWELYDSRGVYCVTTQNMVYYLLVEKMYPFTNNILHQI
nr:hypothetical protein [Tanacetum cinerariifolium]